ncbi:endolytic transglycosylase MltG [Membranihabitans marinus]|uniref:endolytic transglycosylase MltG n=1 Tax=Membranihabitans marinus TaxID=1227546 RepID=UPI001F012D91|nr:endolytic transglycosylase MltG [Membranihabitans marinus]
MNKKWAIILSFFLIASCVTAYIGYQYYSALFHDNVDVGDRTNIVYVYPSSSVDSLITELEPYFVHRGSFNKARRVLSFETSDLKVGRYDIKTVKSNRDLINLFKGGRQSPVKVVIYNENTVSDVVGKISKYLYIDSVSLESYVMQSEALAEAGFSGPNLLALFIPNTYEMYWSISGESLVNRLLRENKVFWERKNRLTKAKEVGLSPFEVYTLASIVDRETLASREKPIVARLYLNRLKKGMLLQADPTVVFANQLFETRRVLYKHLKTDSPYNTYVYPGLPPGPIGISSISGIDAVLNPVDHNYLYMCSKPDNSGLHNFASNLSQHNRNANAYRRWLDAKGIR